jgi:hypothetical protein
MIAETRVRAFYEYHGPDDDTPGTTRYFCGHCRLDLGGIYGHNYHGAPTDWQYLLARNDLSWSEQMRSGLGEDRDYRYYAFCPWCGSKFPDEWWKRDNTPVENARVVDHYRNPGWHRGDHHEFVGAIEGHWLGVSGGDKLCWCDPVVTAEIDGCAIRHTAIDYETWRAMQPEPEPSDDYDDDDLTVAQHDH